MRGSSAERQEVLAVEIVITGRRIEVPERFRRLVQDKLAKISQHAPRAHRIDVELSHERNPRQSQHRERVEITVTGKGPVIRAEASAEDPAAALDLALGKLQERLRRTRDRRKVHHGRQTPVSLREIPGEPLPTLPVQQEGLAEKQDSKKDNGVAEYREITDPDSPVVIRTKDHSASPMTLDQALYEMELVGHDFFLFVDAESGLPSVVYRRRGWNYGVIRLQVAEDRAEAVTEPAYR
jgi:ribosomal subunit interface protein